MSVRIEPLERRTYDAARLLAEHPPVLRSQNKQVIFNEACPPGCVHGGAIEYARWRPMTPPQELALTAAAERAVARAGFYDYEPIKGSDATTEWHVNFADRSLFFGHGSSLFAQDEIQAAEHPALGALREALVAEGLQPVTVDSPGPTPVTVAGVERRCVVATAPDASEGRTEGLYGRAFARASADAVRRATRAIVPPTTTNLVAMAAPGGGYGCYTTPQLEQILITAFTGFQAAALESHRLHGEAGHVVVHTGYWGCGAFGGNRVVMALLQILAARMAGVDRLVLHVGSEDDFRSFDEARDRCSALAGSANSLHGVTERVTALGYAWGESDGI